MRSSCVCDAPAALQWAYRAFDSCINSRAAAASLACGLVSLALSFLVQLPQVVKNARRKSAAALSPWFLARAHASARLLARLRLTPARGSPPQAGWLLGDAANVAGTLLTKQLPTQVANAFFFLLMDATLLLQYLRYDVLPRAARRRAARVAVLAACATAAAAVPHGDGDAHPLALPRCSNRIGVPWRVGARAVAGYALGWLCVGCYLGALGAQLAKNARRRSTCGVSRAMMALLALSNVTYSASVLLRVRTAEEFAAAAPWALGTALAAVLDTAILVQSRVLRAPKRADEALPALAPADGTVDEAIVLH